MGHLYHGYVSLPEGICNKRSWSFGSSNIFTNIYIYTLEIVDTINIMEYVVI